MICNRSDPAITVTELLMGATLSHLDKAHLLKCRNHLARLQHWKLHHELAHFDELRADEFGFDVRLAVFKKHLDHFF